MNDQRRMHDQIDAIVSHLKKTTSHLHDEDMAMFYIEKAQKVLDELRREVFFANRRSGEVR